MIVMDGLTDGDPEILSCLRLATDNSENQHVFQRKQDHLNLLDSLKFKILQVKPRYAVCTFRSCYFVWLACIQAELQKAVYGRRQ